MKLNPINHQINCHTCNHPLNRLSNHNNVVVCKFCNSILWVQTESESGKHVSGVPKDLLSVLQINSQVNLPMLKGTITGFAELLINESYYLIWNLLGENGHVHWILEQTGRYNLFMNVHQKGIINTKITNPKAGKFYTLEQSGNFFNYLCTKVNSLKRFDLFGELFFPTTFSGNGKFMEAVSEDGNSFLAFIENDKQNFCLQGQHVSLTMQSIVNPSFSLSE